MRVSRGLSAWNGGRPLIDGNHIVLTVVGTGLDLREFDPPTLAAVFDSPFPSGSFKVTRTALQNAASVATLLLTSDAVIAEKPKPKSAMPAGGAPDMGGMGGMGGMGF